MIPKEITKALQNWFKEQNRANEISNTQSIGGGSINTVFKITTSDGNWFVKFNTAQAHPKMFESEFKGLKLMEHSGTIRIPEPFYFYEGDQYACILMEWITQGTRSAHFWTRFAQQLGQMHQKTTDFFGLEFDNYMGSLPQKNTKQSEFVSFFIQQRLEPQIKLARDAGFLNQKHIAQCERLYVELPSIFPKEKPALVHGDLWSGNFMNDEKGNPVIMDPAVYYGHREVDMAMTTMFGGFSSQFYQEYQNFYPMESGWESRLEYYKLYPILIHINLFGYSYLGSFERIISNF
jgi:protein-ribulosamine 3-kinase